MKPTLLVTAGMAAVAFASPASALDLSALPDTSTIPEGVQQLSPVAPGMAGVR